MIDYKHKELFLENSINKQLKLEFSGGETITNTDIYAESMEITESLCSENELRFGSCESSVFKIKIANSYISHIGQELVVYAVIGGNTDEPFVFGHYIVQSDVPTADRRYREITAYDAMHDIINADVSEWYHSILPNADSQVALKEFRKSFFEYFGIEQEECELINDDTLICKTIEPEELSGKVVINSICELNGCFGNIGRNGKFRYVILKEMAEGLYPSDDLYPRNDLYPQSPINSESIKKSHYISCKYEDFVTDKISKLQIRKEENDIGVVYGDGDNCYIIQDNFLVYGKSSEELTIVAERIFSVISKVSYRPSEISAKGNPCLEVGDGIRLSTSRIILYTYILNRTIKGIQSLADDYSAEGIEEYSPNVNSVSNSIVELKGKTNILTRSIEETKTEISNLEEQTNSKITQTASSIESEVNRAKESEEQLSSRITQNADSIVSEIERAKTSEEKLSSRISQSAHTIEISVTNGDTTSGIVITLKDEDGNVLNSKNETIKMTGLVSFTDLSSSGKTIINGDNITTGTINCNLLNGGEISGQTFRGGQINIGTGNFVVDLNGNLTTKGTMSLASGKLTYSPSKGLSIEGKVIANSGTIGGFTITGKMIYGGDADTGIICLKVPSDSNTYVLGIGGTTTSSLTDCPFRVTKDGKMYAKDAVFEEYIYLYDPIAEKRYQFVAANQGTAFFLDSLNAKFYKNVDVGGDISTDGKIEAQGNVICSSVKSNTSGYVGDSSNYWERVYTNNIYLGDSRNLNRYIQGLWADGENHAALQMTTDGLGLYLGWNGTNDTGTSYDTYTVLRGKSVLLKNSSGETVTSDERLKNSFKPLDEYDNVYMDINPCAFKYNHGTSNRYHFGAIAQNVRDAFLNNGFTTRDFGGFVQMTDSQKNDDYCGVDDPMGLIYSEFVMWNMYQIQKIIKRLEKLED